MKNWLGLHAHMCMRDSFLAYVNPASWAVIHRTNYTELQVHSSQTGCFFPLSF